MERNIRWTKVVGDTHFLRPSDEYHVKHETVSGGYLVTKTFPDGTIVKEYDYQDERGKYIEINREVIVDHEKKTTRLA